MKDTKPRNNTIRTVRDKNVIHFLDMGAKQCNTMTKMRKLKGPSSQIQWSSSDTNGQNLRNHASGVTF